MNKALLLFVFTSVVCVALGNYIDNADIYRGEKIVEITIANDAERKYIRSLNPDVWTYQSTLQVGRVNRMRLGKKEFEGLMAQMPQMKSNVKVVVEDVAENLRRVARAKRSTPINMNDNKTLKDSWYYEWHSFNEIIGKLEEVAKQYPQYVEMLPTITQSYEGRNITGIRLGRRAAGAKKIAFLAGTHAREWVSETVVLWFLGMTLQELSAGTSIIQQQNVDVYIVPCYNPDGYEYSRTKERYWRKNRRLNYDGSYGVDPNRNWGDHWAEVGVSHDPDDETYCGESAFSEVEVRAMSEFIAKHKFDGLIDFHSVAGMFLRPYGYKFDYCPDEARLKALTVKLVDLVKAVHGTEYENMRGVDLYPASGATDDWSYEVAGVPTVFTIEVGGTDFAPPVSDIQIRGEELYPALREFIISA